MVKNFKKIKLFVIFLSFFFLASVFVTKPLFAQNTEIETIYFTPQIEIPFSSISGETAVGSPDQDGNVTSDLLARYVKALYDYGIMIGGILAAIMLMGGGLIWLTSGGDSGKVTKAKSIITGSITGIVILMGAYFILNTINPDLVQMKGVKMIMPQNINDTEVTCCHPQQGPITISVKKVGNDLFYADSTNKIGGKTKEEGEIFSGCQKELASEDCNSQDNAKCIKDDKLKQHVCINPNNKICCTCIIGDNTILNRHASCQENITQDECTKFCNGELRKYEIEDNKTYRITDDAYRIKHNLYKCTDTARGQICSYTSQGGAGGSW
ncbi:hypothetical protein GW758_03385 [Candidatus Falkowbacteria bacterium]|nr:hypothetical protein [Candidatus Falkowbacteria bacterium]